MTRSIGSPIPDCSARREANRARRHALEAMLDRRGAGVTMPNGEEVRFAGHPLSYHKGLPHDANGVVHAPSYHAMVRMLSHHEHGAVETLPLGANRTAGSTAENPPRYATQADGRALGYRNLTSPFTGHVYETQGADAGAFAMGEAPRVDSDELAAEMAELYAMALLRDVPFTAIVDGTGPNVQVVTQALDSMPWFQPGYVADTPAAQRRYDSRAPIASSADLFRGSTPGAQHGPWVSQLLLAGNRNAGATFENAIGNPGNLGSAAPTFRGTFASIGHEDGFVLYGTQIVDQRSIVAKEGIDFMTNWAAWLDCQNGVDFNGYDVFRDRRRYLTTPRDIATYVHYDALYQAYQVACLLMLGPGASFPRDRGLPESNSRTRSAFASFGGPHVLSLVTEVATRGLKAVWRQKWLHHRRARPEVVAAWLTLHAHDPMLIAEPAFRDAIGALRAKIPASILDMVAAHNVAQNATTDITPLPVPPAGLPAIDALHNFLLPMAFPEGSPTHPAYGAGHATVAGACVTALKAFFEMFDDDGRTERAWPMPVFVPSFVENPGGNANEGGELVAAPAGPTLTIQGELDKLAANIAIARNMAGVHYFTDYHESLRLGERITVSILEEQLSMYGEPVSMTFTSFDGDRIRIASNGDTATVQVTDTAGARVTADAWYARYEE